MARRLSEEVLKVAGLSEDEGECKQASEKTAVEVHMCFPIHIFKRLQLLCSLGLQMRELLARTLEREALKGHRNRSETYSCCCIRGRQHDNSMLVDSADIDVRLCRHEWPSSHVEAQA